MATIKNTRDIGLQSRGVNYRIMKPSINLASYSTSPAGLSYFSKPANSTTLVPASLTLLVTDSFSPGNYSVPVYNWEYSTSADPATYISLGVNTLGLTITNTNFATYAGTGNFVNFRLTVSQVGWTTSTQVYVVEYYRTLAITPVVSLSRSDIILPVSTVGVINYTGTGTSIRVSINNINIPYDVAGTAGPNTFTVTAVGSTTPNTVTVGAATTTTTTVANDTRTFADISGLSATVNPGNIVYTITVRDADGTVSVFTRTQSVVVSLAGAAGAAGASAKTLSITADSYIFKADVNNAIPTSVIKLTANKQNTTNTVSWATTPSISLYSASTGGSVVTTGDIVYLRSTDYAANTSAIVTATISADSLSDTTSILRVKDGSSAITAILSNPVMPLSTTAADVVTYTGSGTTLQVYEGSTLRTITAVPSIAATSITAGSVSGTGTTTVTIGDHSAITQDNAKIVYTATITRGDGTSGNIDVTQSFTKSKAGAAGTNGTSNITISAFKWAIGTAPTATGTATFTWSTKTYNTPPSTWTSAAAAAPGTGYTLYQVNLIVSDVSTATTTAINWANGTIGSIGFRQDGSIGLTGDSHRTAYVVTTSGTAPGSVTAGTGDVVPTNAVASQVTGWSFTATSNLSAGQYMYQVDGTYTNGANIVWGNPYLSNLKVGSLEALSANMGSLTSGTITGALIRTATSGKRVEIDHSTNSMKIYNDAGVEAIVTGGASGTLYVNTPSGLSPGISSYNNSPAVPAVYGSNASTTNSFIGGAGVYGTASACNGVLGWATTTGVGVYGVASLAGGGSQGVRGVNQAKDASGNAGGAGTITSGIVGAANGYDFYADGATSSNYGPFTGAHDVLVPVAVNIATGYIVCDVELVVAKNISNTIFKVAMSSVANQVAVGVMVLNNGLLANAQPAAFVERVDWIEIDGNMQNTTVMCPEYEVVKDLYNYCAVNAVGEGQVYVCGESGNISAGDLIVTSSVAGVGMKQSDNIVRNITVAKARQAITFTDLTTPVLVACIYLCG